MRMVMKKVGRNLYRRRLKLTRDDVEILCALAVFLSVVVRCLIG